MQWPGLHERRKVSCCTCHGKVKRIDAISHIVGATYNTNTLNGLKKTSSISYTFDRSER